MSSTPIIYSGEYSPCVGSIPINAELMHKASEACSQGDFLWYDSINQCLRPANVFTDYGNAPATQQAFASVFAGVSNSQQLAADATAHFCRCLLDLIIEMPCASSTFNPGDYVGLTYSSGLNAQQVSKVTDPALAIGRVVKLYTTATSLVKVRVTSKVFFGMIMMAGQGVGNVNELANFRNIIDGGDFTVNPWQRGTSFTGITNSVTYGPDRFFAIGGASSSISLTQVADTNVAGFGNSLKFQRANSNANTAALNLGQVLESLDCIRMQGRQVTLSFWARTGANYSGGNLTVALNHSTTAGNDTAAHLAAASTNWQATPTIINASQALTSTMTRYTFTGIVPATATQLGLLLTWTPAGTAGADDSIYINGVQLEDGNQASEFEHRDVEVELALCQRYYFQLNEANGANVATGAPTGTNTQGYSVWLATPMRVAPSTVTFTAGGFKLIIDGAAATAVTSPAAGSAHSPTVISLATGNTLTAAAHSILLQGSNTTGVISASADF